MIYSINTNKSEHISTVTNDDAAVTNPFTQNRTCKLPAQRGKVILQLLGLSNIWYLRFSFSVQGGLKQQRTGRPCDALKTDFVFTLITGA